MLNRFRHEMIHRREKLAFMMDKIYYIRKLQPEVYARLYESGAFTQIK